jgi:hypothetical protein
VGAVDEAAADVHRRRVPAFDVERGETDGGAGDVDDGIYGADLMKMYLIQWHIVDGGFGFAEKFEGAERECAGLVRQRRVVENFANSRQIAAVLMRVIRGVFVIMRVRMIVMMLMLVFVRMGMIVRRIGFVAADQYTDLAGADAAAVYGFEGEGCAEVERGSGLLEELGRDTSVDQSAEEHVSAEAGEAFEIANAHGCFL